MAVASLRLKHRLQEEKTIYTHVHCILLNEWGNILNIFLFFSAEMLITIS